MRRKIQTVLLLVKSNLGRAAGGSWRAALALSTYRKAMLGFDAVLATPGLLPVQRGMEQLRQE